jgi:hypothetical protein
VYDDFGSPSGGTSWAPLDATGAALGSPVLLSPNSTGTYVRAPVASVGGAAVVLLGAHGTEEAWTFELLRVASGAAAYPVAYDEPIVYEYQLAPLGSQVVAAWIGARYPERIGLALVTP